MYVYNYKKNKSKHICYKFYAYACMYACHACRPNCVIRKDKSMDFNIS